MPCSLRFDPRRAPWPGTLDKLREARKIIDESGYDIALEIDGGVTTKNIKEIKEAGATMFVAGSAIFGSALPT